MKSSYLTHFGLAAPPFTKELEDTELWLPPSKQQIVDQLVEALEAREQVVLIGEPGAGKTCVLRALRQRVRAPSFRLTYCHNVTLGRRDFYRQLCLALGLAPSATAAAVFFAVSTHVQSLVEHRSYPVFVLDEAHLLHQDVLEHLHILLNYEWDAKALLSLVLVGLPELEDRLALRKNRSLYSRIHHRLRIDLWPEHDTAAYLEARLAKVGGGGRTLFSPEALTSLHEMAAGSLREIDRVATGSLKIAAGKRARVVEAKHLASLPNLSALEELPNKRLPARRA